MFCTCGVTVVWLQLVQLRVAYPAGETDHVAFCPQGTPLTEYTPDAEQMTELPLIVNEPAPLVTVQILLAAYTVPPMVADTLTLLCALPQTGVSESVAAVVVMVAGAALPL
jgi:hypothetical protein